MIKNYKQKLSLIVVSLLMLMLSVSICMAEPEITKIKQISSVVDFTFINPKVNHIQISSVVANGVLNAKVTADFGNYTYADSILEYKVDSGEVKEVRKEGVSDGSYFYLGTDKGDIEKDSSVVAYRIKTIFKNDNTEFVVYSPDGVSSTTFVNVPVINKTEEMINGGTGGEINVYSGDQSKGENDTIKIIVPAGAYEGDHKVIVTFVEDSTESVYSLSSPKIKETVVSNIKVEVEGVSELLSPIQILNVPLDKQSQATKFVMQYKNSNWEEINNVNLSVNTSKQVYSFNAVKLGYYRVLENIVLTDSSYRPAKRALLKSRYAGFEFKNLKEGDTVKIYNIKGKKIAELTAGDSNGFIWVGRKGTNNSGDWAKTGIYIYQIKVNGKTISGTIALVK